MTKFIQQEILKILKGKQSDENEKVNFVQMDDFAGSATTPQSILHIESPKHWIVDTGATNHICAIREFFIHLKHLVKKKVVIHLPDGTSKLVLFFGDIRMSDFLILRDVLYIPSFKHNLLSVSKLTECHNLKLTFHPSFCLIQDLKTDKVFAVGKLQNHLYT